MSYERQKGNRKDRRDCRFGNDAALFLNRNSLRKTDGIFLTSPAFARDMLHPMQQATDSAPSAAANSFAGLLASLTTTKPSPAPAWNDDDLADDAVTLSYENALRTHARYRAVDPTDRPLTQPARTESKQIDSYELAPVEEAPKAKFWKPVAEPRPAPPALPEAAHPVPTPFERNLKSASITIRMSKDEAAQLHRRAAEAGLTVSAYLRSCTFEAESLRAMVKDTMAQLKAASSAGDRAGRGHSSLGGRLGRLFTPWRAPRQMARA